MRTGENKVEYLRKEEEEKRLGKVRLDAHNRECHARHVAERIAGKRTRGIPADAGQRTYDQKRAITHQLWYKKPRQTPTSGSMKYRLKR